jgi:hypothetical protein
VIRIEGSDDLQRVANALKEAGDRDLQKQVSSALRGVAKPLGERVLQRASGKMPRRGGLAERVAGMGRVGVSSSLRGRVASVQVILRNKGVDLKAMDAGFVRHPVFGNRHAWARQTVPARAFTEAFEAESAEVQKAATKAAQDVLDDVARKA